MSSDTCSAVVTTAAHPCQMLLSQPAVGVLDLIRQLLLHNGRARLVLSLLLGVGSRLGQLAMPWSGVRPGSISFLVVVAWRRLLHVKCSRRLVRQKSLVVEYSAKGLLCHPSEMTAWTKIFS